MKHFINFCIILALLGTTTAWGNVLKAQCHDKQNRLHYFVCKTDSKWKEVHWVITGPGKPTSMPPGTASFSKHCTADTKIWNAPKKPTIKKYCVENLNIGEEHEEAGTL